MSTKNNLPQTSPDCNTPLLGQFFFTLAKLNKLADEILRAPMNEGSDLLAAYLLAGDCGNDLCLIINSTDFESELGELHGGYEAALDAHFGGER